MKNIKAEIIKKFREKVREVIDECGHHSLSEDSIIHIKDSLGITVSQAIDRIGEEDKTILAKYILKEWNEHRENEHTWPAGQEWDDLVSSSQSTLLRHAQEFINSQEE